MDSRKYIIVFIAGIIMLLAVLCLLLFSCQLCATKEKYKCQANNAINAIQAENKKSDIIYQIKQKSVSERRKMLEKYIVNEV